MGCVQSVGEEEDVSVNEKEALHENEFITVVLNDYIEDSNEKDYEDTGEDRMERVPASGPILVRDDGEEGARGGKRKKKKNVNILDRNGKSSDNGSSNSPSHSEKNVVTAMNKLQNVIRNMHKDVMERLQQHMHPTEEQLAIFVCKMVNVLKMWQEMPPLA